MSKQTLLENIGRLSEGENNETLWINTLENFDRLSDHVKAELIPQLSPQFLEVYFNDPGRDFLWLFAWDVNKACIYKDLYSFTNSPEFKNYEGDYIEEKELDHILQHGNCNLFVRHEALLWKHWIPREYKKGYKLIDRIPENISATDFLQLKISHDLSLGEELRLYTRCSETTREELKDCVDSKLLDIYNNLHPHQLYLREFNIPLLTADMECFSVWSREELKKELDRFFMESGRVVFDFCNKYYKHLPYCNSEQDYPILYLLYLYQGYLGFSATALTRHLMIETDLPKMTRNYIL